jgi:hypothetical protein
VKLRIVSAGKGGLFSSIKKVNHCCCCLALCSMLRLTSKLLKTKISWSRSAQATDICLCGPTIAHCLAEFLGAH